MSTVSKATTSVLFSILPLRQVFSLWPWLILSNMFSARSLFDTSSSGRSRFRC
jgi:hypothetical protein